LMRVLLRNDGADRAHQDSLIEAQPGPLLEPAPVRPVRLILDRIVNSSSEERVPHQA
jgi:hypothetical protein